jgi:DNA-binding transcriptional LysR family regulator
VSTHPVLRKTDQLALETQRPVVSDLYQGAVATALYVPGDAPVTMYQIEKELRSGALVALLEDFAPEPLPVSLIYPDVGLLAPKARAFIDWTVLQLRAHLL